MPRPRRKPKERKPVDMEFIEVSDRLPEEYDEPHTHPLWIATEKYGCMGGFYYKGKFMRNYACEILDVVAWLSLPKY